MKNPVSSKQGRQAKQSQSDCSKVNALGSRNDNHKIWIAVGRGLSKVTCKQVTWRKLKKRLSNPFIDTGTTLTEYFRLVEKSNSEDKAKAKAATDRLLELKSAPGNWTAAQYKGANRKAPDVVGKSCIVQDLDYVKQRQLDFIIDGKAAINRWAWFMHTSRSHIPEKPRTRLVIPANRLMTPEDEIDDLLA